MPIGSCREALFYQGAERNTPMAVGRLLRKSGIVDRHLAKGDALAIRLEYRVVAETARSTGRPDDRSVHSALYSFVVAIRPGQHQNGDEGS